MDQHLFSVIFSQSELRIQTSQTNRKKFQRKRTNLGSKIYFDRLENKQITDTLFFKYCSSNIEKKIGFLQIRPKLLRLKFSYFKLLSH